MDYIDRVGTALDYIEGHLTEDISLEEIAHQAHSSLFWFHRVFSMLVGDSLGEYLRKRRLDCAGAELVHSDQRIIDIAVKYGFSRSDSKLIYGSTLKNTLKQGTFARSIRIWNWNLL